MTLTWLTLFLVCLSTYDISTAESLINEYLRLNILVVGRTGSGKSTLINNILGHEIAKVGHEVDPQTTTTSVYQRTISGVDVTACDTPGLRDATGQDEEHIKKIKVSCGDPDLVIFCHSIASIRWQNDDEETIELFTKHFGINIWRHSLLVLTFADEMKLIGGQAQKKQFMIDRRGKIEGYFHKSLSKNGVDYKIPSTLSAKGEKDLPGVPNWLSELFVSCTSQVSEHGRNPLTQIILGRLRYPEDATEDDFKKPEHEQFIFLTLCQLIKLNPGKWSGVVLGPKALGYIAGKVLGGMFAGPVGWAVGAAAGYGIGFSLDYILSLITCPKDSEQHSANKTEL